MVQVELLNAEAEAKIGHDPNFETFDFDGKPLITFRVATEDGGVSKEVNCRFDDNGQIVFPSNRMIEIMANVVLAEYPNAPNPERKVIFGQLVEKMFILSMGVDDAN